jgi:DNA invertase Pin-like site-specific DNA recombinase
MVRKPNRVALYVRVSTDGQTVENQRRELLAAAERHGWRVVDVFEDKGVSGSKARDQRPAMKRLMEGVSRREFDMVAAWNLDRLGRSLKDLIGFLDEINEKRIDLYVHDFQGGALDTSTASGRLMFQITSAFAEFERATIVERVKAGICRAQAEQQQSKRRIGRDGKPRRPIGRPGVGAEEKAAVLAARGRGDSIGAIAKALGMKRSTVGKIALMGEGREDR